MTDLDPILKSHPVTVAGVQPAHVMALTHFVRVDGVAKARDGTDVLSVTDLDTGTRFDVKGRELIELTKSADQAHEEVRVTATQMEAILTTRLAGKPFTVCFVKKEGEERTLRGRYVGPRPFAYTLVEDFDVPERDPAKRYRNVDQRTIKWLVLDGVKYVVNKK